MNGTNPSIIVKYYEHPSTMNKKKKRSPGAWVFRPDSQLSRSSLRFLRRLGDKTARVLRFVSPQRPSRKISSSTGHASMARSRSLVDLHTTESHRAEAIEDCIEFLNSYSSLHRSSSVSFRAC
ncbi:hypothetical protein SAY87_022547 [Trapa incisa]|uniref:Josephin-like protein n=2 Tax=Trapa TaxID=22665 RepID=A0AAN7R064_TRANT|nr:hypothetical protein SAY87_022547 [Trapa incisa]KAK4782705.1 hypothetical protein SAY86_007079 [Trapa natans]